MYKSDFFYKFQLSKITYITEPRDVKFININGAEWYYNMDNHEEDKILNKLKLITKPNYNKELVYELYDILRLNLAREEENIKINFAIMEN